MPPPKYNLSDAELKNSKAIYTEKETYRLQVLNVYLFIVYYVLIFIASYFLLTAYDFEMYQSIPIVLFLLIMPFVMYSVQSYVIDSSNYFSALLLGDTYEKKD
tara:strand:+ start:1182 stop:1490 length:309 start_codon:yes stop_codon:yes gene_type:complete